MSKRLFIRNLSSVTTEKDLYDLFSKVGQVNLIIFAINDRMTKSKESCIIDMETPEMAQSAIRKLNGQLLHGQAVQITATRPPSHEASLS